MGADQKLHWATSRSAHTACGIAKIAVAITVRPNDVTCGPCKRAIAITPPYASPKEHR